MGLFDNVFNKKPSVPNVAELEAKKDVKGLINALYYGEKLYNSYKPGTIRNSFDSDRIEVSKIVFSAAIALGQIKDISAVEPIIKTFDEDRYSILRVDYIFPATNNLSPILAMFGTSAIKPILNGIKVCKPDMRQVLLISLGLIGDPSSTQDLLNYAKNSDGSYNYDTAIVFAIANSGTGLEAVKYLIKAFDKGNVKERYSKSGLSSGRFGNDAIMELVNVVENKDKVSQNTFRTATEILCKQGNTSGLEAMLSMPIKDIRVGNIIASTGKFNDPRLKEYYYKIIEEYNNKKFPQTIKNVTIENLVIHQDALFAAIGLAELKDSKYKNILMDAYENNNFKNIEWDGVILQEIITKAIAKIQ